MSKRILFSYKPVLAVRLYSVASFIVLVLLANTPFAEARERDPLVGPFPYDYSTRANVQSSLLLQEARQRRQSASSRPASYAASSGDSASPRVVTQTGTDSKFVIINNTSTSISVGNWQQIEMTLGDGAEGLIMTESHQNSHGKTNSMSNANTLPGANTPTLTTRQD